MRMLLVAAVFTALWALAPPDFADQDDPRLARLFHELQSLDQRRSERADELQARIWRIWFQHPGAEMHQAMAQGETALTQQHYEAAVDAFSRAIELDPGFAEAWNRRATTYFQIGRYRDSLDDIQRVLALEPRHFGALAGRGLCLRALDRPAEALEAYKKALQINPHLEHVYLEIVRLRAQLGRKGPL